MKQAVNIPPPPPLPPDIIQSSFQTCLSHTTYIKEFPRNEDSDNILHEAAAVGDIDTLKQLLTRNHSTEFVNRRDHLGCTPLRIAASGELSFVYVNIIHTHTHTHTHTQF